MPIILTHPIKALTEHEFHKLDYSVMALAFEMHNELGRFYNEQIYKKKLLKKCLEKGFDTKCEVEIKLRHHDYCKSLFIDLLINNCVYELKTIKSIQDPQRIQALDYIFVTNTKHGKIINFLPPSVEHEFVSTTLDLKTRKQFRIKDSRWNKYSENAQRLKCTMIDLLTDWGAFLSTHQYIDALIHFFGGEHEVVHSVNIRSGKQLLGQQKFFCISESESFLITASKGVTRRYETHLSRLLCHTPFSYLHWINLNRSTIEFSTLKNQSFCSNYSVT